MTLVWRDTSLKVVLLKNLSWIMIKTCVLITFLFQIFLCYETKLQKLPAEKIMFFGLDDKNGLQGDYFPHFCYHVVNWHYFSWSSWFEYLFTRFAASDMSGHLVMGSKRSVASHTSIVWSAFWYLLVFCPLFWMINWQVIPSAIPVHQLCLLIISLGTSFEDSFFIKWWPWGEDMWTDSIFLLLAFMG